MQKRTFFKRLFVGLLLAIIVCMGVVIYQLQASLHAVQPHWVTISESVCWNRQFRTIIMNRSMIPS